MTKKTCKTTLFFTAFIFTLSVSLLSFNANAETWMARYYKKNPMSVQDLKSDWGEPENIVTKENGVQKMIFGPKDVEIGYTYFLVQNGQIIDRGTTNSLEKNAVAKTKGPVAKGSMAQYYQTNPVSEKNLVEKLGKPAGSCTYENGVTRLYYGPKDPEIGYTTYLVKNGMIIDKNHSMIMDKNQNQSEYQGPEARGWMANYYKTHPMTLEQLKTRYGTPISNHDYPNGVKKLTFGPKDAEIGYTYFLVKDGMVIDKNVTGK